MSLQAGLLQSGLDALEQHRYADAVHLLEQACRMGTDVESQDHLRSQINLVRAYQRNGQLKQAIALSRRLANSSNPQVKTWAEQALRSLSKAASQSSPSSQSPQVARPASHLSHSASASESTGELLKQGSEALKQKRYADAVQTLETYCVEADSATPDYEQAQIWLSKAYKGNQQPEKAIALGRQLMTSHDLMVQTWAQQFVGSLTAVAMLQATAPSAIASSSAQPATSAPTPTSSAPDTSTQSAVQLKSLSELQQFYQDHLLQDLQHVEKMRQSVVQRIKTISLTLLLVTAIAGIAMLSFGINLYWLLIGFVLFLTVWVSLYSAATGEYVMGFKARKIVEKIISAIDPNLTYCPFATKYSSRMAFTDSQLFKHLTTPDRFTEDDCVFGQIGETRIAFSEVHAERIRHTSDDRDRDFRSLQAISHVISRVAKGQRIVYADFLSEAFGNTMYSTIFKGIFFTANFNKQFQFKTFVFPDSAERFFGGLANTLQGMNKRHGQLVKLEDPEFERLFAVYSEDQVEARYILSTNLMARLVQFKKKSRRDLSIAFVNNAIYVAIACEEDLFEPKLYSSMTDFRPIQEYFENLQLVIGIVEELKLNRRIWST